MRAACCTKEVMPVTGRTLGKLIVRHAAHTSGWPRILEAQFIGNSLLSAPLEADVHVPRAGFVYLWLAMCDKNLDSSKVFGHTEWHAHGWGYLPGMLSNCLLVQAGMLLLYLALHLLWRPNSAPPGAPSTAIPSPTSSPSSSSSPSSPPSPPS
ncbi:hypothetical protein CLOP_g11265 [Closterium sp. NIES-67]|nr:hypothetical protein CLOP_g11265 [Closterium sp. NIES-67]